MDETRAVAHLPKPAIEILHRQLPDERAGLLPISLRTQPSFEACRWLDAPGPWTWPALNPFLAWRQAVPALWAPWLAATSCSLPGPGTPRRGAER